MGAYYIGIILVCRIAQHLCNKKSSNAVTDMPMFVSYSAFRQLLSAVMGLFMIAVAGNGFKCDLKTVLISVFSGAMLVVSMLCSIFAMKSGTVALVSMFSTAGLIVPCIAGIFLFGIPIKPLQWLGVVIFLGAAYLLIMSSKEVYKSFSVKTLILLMGGLLSNGLVMLAQQMFANYVPDGDVSVFSFLSFGIVGAAMAVLTPFMYKAKDGKRERLSKELIIYGVVLSVCVFIINQLATLSAAIVPPVILFTFINGGSTIIGAIVAAACYREKFTVKSTVGIIVGVLALIMIKAFE